MKTFAKSLLVIAFGLVGSVASAETVAPKVPTDVKGKEGVKAYLVGVITNINTSAKNLKTAAVEYDALCTKDGGPQGAAKSEPQKVAALIKSMRESYQGIDSFGYEYIEGIVAGVPSLMKYDVELDSGTPKALAGSAQDSIADIVIKAGDITLDHEGSLNNFLIEPTVFGTNPRFIDGKATLPGFDKPIGLPKPKVIIGLADYAIDGYGRLTKDANAWQPTDKDCFQVLANMTPTLADYFDEWKEAKKYGNAVGGRFVAVSRVSDMRGIMASTQLTWLSLEPQVQTKDAQLAGQITKSYVQIMSFIDKVDARDKAKPLNVQTIDALGSQAKERADQTTVQATQAAALLGINVNSR